MIWVVFNAFVFGLYLWKQFVVALVILVIIFSHQHVAPDFSSPTLKSNNTFLLCFRFCRMSWSGDLAFSLSVTISFSSSIYSVIFVLLLFGLLLFLVSCLVLVCLAVLFSTNIFLNKHIHTLKYIFTSVTCATFFNFSPAVFPPQYWVDRAEGAISVFR